MSKAKKPRETPFVLESVTIPAISLDITEMQMLSADVKAMSMEDVPRGTLQIELDTPQVKRNDVDKHFKGMENVMLESNFENDILTVREVILISKKIGVKAIDVYNYIEELDDVRNRVWDKAIMEYVVSKREVMQTLLDKVFSQTPTYDD